MNQDSLFPFGNSNVATVHLSGIVDIRVVDDHDHRTLTAEMNVDEFARIAKSVFANVRNDTNNTQRERDNADDVNGKLMNFVQGWGD